jgi:hypothetical protein
VGIDDQVQQVDLGIYVKSGLSREFRQGEILSTVARYSVNPIDKTYSPIVYPYAIIAAQDCDLLQDFEKRAKDNSGSICEVVIYPAQKTVDTFATIKGSDIKKRIENNKDERYHLFEEVDKDKDLLGQGVPSLLVDFKMLFTLSIPDLQIQIEAGTANRRTRLEMPYREHFQSRAAFYFQRVMLPRQHNAPSCE